jgi:transcriptional regulator with XRE-family HTH domain
MHFGQILRSRRRKLGRTGQDIANIIGVSQSYVSSIENSMTPDNYYYSRYREVLTELELERLRELINQYLEEAWKVVAERLGSLFATLGRSRGDTRRC